MCVLRYWGKKNSDLFVMRKDRLVVPNMKVLKNEKIEDIVVESIDTMSIPLKTVGILRFFEGMKVEEIMSILDVPRDIINIRIYLIKKSVSMDLERQGIILHREYGSVMVTPLLREAYIKLSEKYVMKEADAKRILDSLMDKKYH